MNNLYKIFILAGCTLAGTLATPATVFRDIDTVGIYMKKEGSDAQKKVSGTFDIVVGDGSFNVTIGSPYLPTPQAFDDVAGYKPSDFVVTGATAFFYFRDDAADNEKEEVQIKFVKSPGDHDGGGGDGNDFKFAEAELNNKTFTILSGSVNATIVAALHDGVLAYEVKADKGDFYFDFARLEVQATAVPSAPVPQTLATPLPDSGSAMGLLLLGGLAVQACRRARRA